MKITFVLLSLFVTLTSITAQDFNITPLKEKSDYKKVEAQVKAASEYLFETPVNKNVTTRSQATKLVMKWMEGTPDYTFEIEPKILEITKDDPELFGLYLTSMTYTVLSHPHERLSDEKLFKLSTKQLAEYCSNKENKLKPNKGLKKVMKDLDI